MPKAPWSSHIKLASRPIANPTGGEKHAIGRPGVIEQRINAAVNLGIIVLSRRNRTASAGRANEDKRLRFCYLFANRSRANP